ncbi:MAG TPA: MlaD family protein [Bacteroidales bacterium]|nr:MlaD family protein [Bacteroidales bacterium]HSA44772.1 MlaD family protein [Bacteroidales bacterium]
MAFAVKISRELKIGLLFVAALALFIYGFNFLKGRDVFKQERQFHSVYESVSGLVPSSPVFINGIKVGIVKETGFHPDGSNRILVSYVLTNKVPVPVNSIARIYSSDLMGSKAIDIILGDSAVLASDGDTLPSQVQASLQEEVNRQVLPLKTKAEALMGSVDSALMVIRYVFNESTRDNLEKSFASIKQTIANLEHTTFNIDTLVSSQRSRMAGILVNLESISANIRNNNQHISNILANFSALSDSIARANISKTLALVNHSLQQTSDILAKIKQGEGSLGLLLNNDGLYRELEKSSKDLNLLLEDMRLHPDRYIHFSVFGRNPKKNQYSPPPEK